MSDSARIRMYNVGFGDSFLLVLPGNRTMLIDAGFHTQGKGKFSGNELAEQIALDVKKVSGSSRIDVVVATHRHADHIFAFNSEKWSEIDVGEVWLPWVEDRNNKQATKLWKKQAHFAAGLAAALDSFNLAQGDRDAIEFMLWNAGVNVYDASALAGFEAWSNSAALDCLHEGFNHRDRPTPRFLRETEAFPESFETPLPPGVRVHVLGPPRDPELIEELDPEADGETYRAIALRAAAAALAGGSANVTPPFGKAWQVEDGELGFMLEMPEIERLRTLAHDADALLAAEKVDGMINSTSLVLVLEIGKARLLLPGDAEWGTWKRILASSEARALIHGATFLKVGHHGSHNATSKTLVEKVLPKKIPAMISTQEGPGKYRNNIPLPDLLEALSEREVHYVRSDRPDQSLPDHFEKGPKWIDLTLRC